MYDCTGRQALVADAEWRSRHAELRRFYKHRQGLEMVRGSRM